MKLLCESRSYSKEVDTHHHNYGQLIIPYEGILKIKTNNYEINLDKNHIFYLPKDCTHLFSANNKNRFLVVDVPNELNHMMLGDVVKEEQYRILDDRWKAIRYLMTEEAKRSNIQALKDLLRYAFSYLREDAVPRSIQYIHEHFDENISINELAALENYNVTYFVEWFYKQTGMTPNIYIQKTRLNQAKRYLEETDYDLLMISKLIGYEHQSSLTRLFKKHGYMSPSYYRKNRDKDKKKIVLVK